MTIALGFVLQFQLLKKKIGKAIPQRKTNSNTTTY